MKSLLTTFAAVFLGLVTTAFAQGTNESSVPNASSPGRIGIFGRLGKGPPADDDVKAAAKFELTPGTRQGKLTIEVKIPEKYHIYSLTQKGGPKPTIIKVKESPGMTIGAFAPDRDFHAHVSTDFGDPVSLEEYEGVVNFVAPFDLLPGADAAALEPQLEIRGQVCANNCRDFNLSLTAEYVAAAPVAVAVLRPEGSHLTLQGRLDTSAVAGGGRAKLLIHAIPEPGYHLYGYEAFRAEKPRVESPTLIALTRKGDWRQNRARIDPAPARSSSLVGTTEAVHEKPVTFTIELTPSKSTTPLTQLVGYIGFQTCADSCDGPTAVKFEVDVPGAGAKDVPVLFSASDLTYEEVAKLAKSAAAADPLLAPIDWNRLGVILIFAFLGGIILNLMPCVLPVIGLKILSFARQGGQSHAHVFALNLAYSVGLITVFLILAGLAAFLNLGWGDQFQNIYFKITMTAVVFVMALSFLGTWELPVPGFATSGKAGELQNQHGYFGAFFKGMFTTLLATPCSGPFLGAVFAFALRQQPTVIFLIFGCIGLGMASPYLLIGTFPSLVKFLPKPGEWMETFERIVGFALLGTVVYLFSTFGSENMHLFVPTLALLVGLWFGCWLIGQVPEYAGLGKRLMTWGAAAAMAGVVGYGSFAFMGGHSRYLQWEPYSEARLQEHLKAGKTVMIDFTAEWCLTCKYNLKSAIDTAGVHELTQKNGVVTMIADKTNPNPAIEDKLLEFDSKSIPLLAIIPGRNPEQPIVLRDLVSQSQVLESLEKAGPSKPQPKAEAGKGATAMVQPAAVMP